MTGFYIHNTIYVLAVQVVGVSVEEVFGGGDGDVGERQEAKHHRLGRRDEDLVHGARQHRHNRQVQVVLDNRSI